MRNRFPGKCYRCGGHVPTGEGHFERPSRRTYEKLELAAIGGRWLIQHADCAIKHRGTNHTYWKKVAANG
ncbi:MAG: hypothetical protein COA78_14320 [Blastopirellula sp.]|nr:MAG: hypothetical protein COA78_14320 [Blastopirellula sp.]